MLRLPVNRQPCFGTGRAELAVTAVTRCAVFHSRRPFPPARRLARLLRAEARLSETTNDKHMARSIISRRITGFPQRRLQPHCRAGVSSLLRLAHAASLGRARPGDARALRPEPADAADAPSIITLLLPSPKLVRG